MARGEGYLRKRGKVFYFEFMYKGQRYYEKIGVVSKTVAKEIANEIRSRIIRGEYIPQKERKTTFSDAVRVYIEWYRKKSTAREKSKEENIRRARRLEEFFGSRKLSQISTFLVESYKKKRLEEGVKPQTINMELNILGSILRRAKEAGLFDGELPKIEKFRNADRERLRFLSEREAQRLISACPEWFKPVVIFALNTGLRAGEIFSLRWEDVDFERGVITVREASSKSGKVRKLPMNATVKKLLQGLERKEHGYIFTNRFGLPYKYEDKTYRRVFKTACEKAGIKDFRFHDLRHTFASWVAMNSKDIYAVQNLLGHSSPSVTKRYAHLTDDYLRSVVESVPNFGSSSASEK
ncbi:site-specific integrase [Hydrogenivirga sp. 128-5-R1-1]|uniref:tyrosine-type recombinase/integrase n=1 Tax=Hydrogenivirga sp. 128-5-R1-1 TaxID=392423 RepID=UPI00015F18F9|nr:site-specific integrase [Hydrogenivirga sp. 128-5-R1-1]EDP75360.1 phage integrase family protein [Hydrogenivirga sp. 128-5-R1-1]